MKTFEEWEVDYLEEAKGGWAAAQIKANRERMKSEKEEAKVIAKQQAAGVRLTNRVAKKESIKILASQIVQKVEQLTFLTFPDGDPIDIVTPWLIKNNLDWDNVDKAFKKIRGQGFYEWLADSWDQSQSDAMHSATHGMPDEDSVFYYIDTVKGLPTKKRNPWKGHMPDHNQYN